MTHSTSENLHYHILPGKQVEAGGRQLYQNAYAFWKNIWSHTFYELKGNALLYSDEFREQDEISVLTLDDAIVGMVSFRWMDLECEADSDDSYFKIYTKELFEKVRSTSQANIMIMSYLGVDPVWRKSLAGTFASEVLIGLATKRFLASPAQSLISYTRNNRRINDLVYRYGAIALKKGQLEHGVEVDLIAVSRAGVRRSPFTGIPETVESLWDQRVGYQSVINEGRFKNEGKVSKSDGAIGGSRRSFQLGEPKRIS